MPSGVRSEADLPPFGEFIVSFGVKYRRRRLTLVIQAVSEMYHRLSEPRFARASSGELDRLKHRLYQCLDDLRIYDSAEFLSAAMRSQICSAFKAARPEAASDPDQFVADHLATMSQLFNRLRQECSLFAANENVDAVLASPEVFQMGAAVQEELLIRYIGFIFWDLVLLPMTSSLDLDVGTLEEILVDRISPEDASTLQPPSGQAAVQGGSLAGFGGFFSRAVRESDYLWGRIHAIDRLFDLLASTADSHLGYEKPDMLAFKKRAFETVLNAEAGRLTSIRPLIAHLQASVAAL